MGSEGLHEERSGLPETVIDRHRAIVSLMEELEAVDWYDQRVAATADPALAEILAHNRDEEKEHAAMNLEWLRRNDAGFDEVLRTYLFTDRPVTEVEDHATGGADADGDGDGDGHDEADAPRADLGIGSLRGEESL
ncbi:MAG: ferritin-like domain-containing protein [Acidimicrobiales bacterium]